MSSNERQERGDTGLAQASLFSNQAMWRVTWGQCDPAGIVFNPRFFEVFDDCTAQLLAAATGLEKRALMATHAAAGIPLVKTSAQFFSPISYGQTVFVLSTVRRPSRSSFEVRHQVIAGGATAAVGDETRVWTAMGPDGQLKAAPIPDAVRAALETGAEPDNRSS